MNPTFDRRRFIAVAGGTAVTLAACGKEPSARLVQAKSPAVAAREAQQMGSGTATVERSLRAAKIDVDLAGRTVRTWGYGALPGAELRVKAGNIPRVRLDNDLPEDTTIHWHGIALRNDMDGVPDLTQDAVQPGRSLTYEFTVPDPGTYFFHPHVGLQLDRALYAPLIVEDPAEPLSYDVEHTLIFDDWLDGIDGTPDAKLEALTGTGGAGGHAAHGGGGGTMDAAVMSSMQSRILGGHAGDIAHPLHLINGRPPADRPTIDASPSGRVRLRLINAGTDTAYRFAVGGHRLTVTHADGFPVRPVEISALLLGMGERYDVVLTAASGAWPVVALAEGKNKAAAAAVLRTSDASAAAPPPVNSRPRELDGKLLSYGDLQPVDGVALPLRRADRRFLVDLRGSHEDGYRWSINGKSHPDGARFDINEGQRVELAFRNRTSMWHPMHLHGHSFAVDPGRGGGARKDTVNVLPNKTVVVAFDADNPGRWMVHCHNSYHLEAGMAAVVAYLA